MKPILIIQEPRGNILKIYKDGRVICNCLSNLWNRDRNYASHCSHSQKLVEDFPDLSGYTIIKEN